MVAEDTSSIPTRYSFIKPKEGATRVKEWKKKNKVEVNKTERIRKERLSKFINELKDLLEKDSGTVLGSKETVIKAAIERLISLKAELSTLIKNGTSERVSRELELVQKRNKILEEEKKRYIEILKSNALPTDVNLDQQYRKQPKRKIQRLNTADPCKNKQMKALNSSVMIVEPTKNLVSQQLLDDGQRLQHVFTEIEKENLELPATATTNPGTTTVMPGHSPQQYPTFTKVAVDSMTTSKNRDQKRWIEKALDVPSQALIAHRSEATKNLDNMPQPSSSALQLPPISRMMRCVKNPDSQQQRIEGDHPPQPPPTNLQSWLNSSNDHHHNDGDKTSENNNNNNHLHQQRGTVMSKSLSFTIDGLMQDQQSSVTRCQRSSAQLQPSLHRVLADQPRLSAKLATTGNVDRASKTLWQPAINSSYTAHNNTRPLHYPKSGEDAIRKVSISSYVPQPPPNPNQNPWINSNCTRQVYNQNYNETVGNCSAFQQSPEGSSNPPYWLSTTPHHYKRSLESPTTYHHPDCELSKPPPVTPSFWSNPPSSSVLTNSIWQLID